MRISGNLLPALPNPLNKELSDNRQLLSERNLESEQKNRQQTVEYVFKGEILEETSSEDRNQNPYSQTVDPANQAAISSYSDAGSSSTRQGQLIDFFI